MISSASANTTRREFIGAASLGSAKYPGLVNHRRGCPEKKERDARPTDRDEAPEEPLPAGSGGATPPPPPPPRRRGGGARGAGGGGGREGGSPGPPGRRCGRSGKSIRSADGLP